MSGRLSNDRLAEALRLCEHGCTITDQRETVWPAFRELVARRAAESSLPAMLAAELQSRGFRVCEEIDGGDYLNGYRELSPVDEAHIVDVIEYVLSALGGNR